MLFLTAPAEVATHVNRCAHSHAMEMRLEEGDECVERYQELLPTPSLRDAKFGVEDSVVLLATPSPRAIFSVGLSEGVCGHTMFSAGDDKVFSCMLCR